MERTLQSIRDCRDRLREHEAAMWLNAAYALRRGASIGELATATGTHRGEVERRIGRVFGDD